MPVAASRAPAPGKKRDAQIPIMPLDTSSLCQISMAYWAIVWSLENFREPATFRMALRAQASAIGVQCVQPLVREIGLEVG